MKDARNDRRINPHGSDWMQMLAIHHRGWQSEKQITQQLYKDNLIERGDLRATCAGSSPGHL